MMKMAGEKSASVKHPNIECLERKKTFDIYMDFFGLQNVPENKEKHEKASAVKYDDTDQSIIHDQKVLLANMKAELDDLESKLDVEESFVSYFMKK